jgi:hypothetical protein
MSIRIESSLPSTPARGHLLTVSSAEPIWGMDLQQPVSLSATQRHYLRRVFLMNGNHFARRMGSRRNLLALLASSAVFTAGCSNLATTAPTAAPLATGGTLNGTIHGGAQPIAFSTVTLYFAGQNGVGSGDPAAGASLGAPIVAAVTTSADDGHGSFAFQKKADASQVNTPDSFACPNGDPLVYVVARGGNPLGNHDPGLNNSASAFIAMYGQCSQISSANVVTMNEVTTVATMVALQQYFNPTTESIGADGIGVHKFALTQAINTISNLANMSTGAAISSKNTSSGPATVTITPESAKVNALANIIASCVNNQTATASPCTTLFGNATPPDTAVTGRPYHSSPFAPATDVLQALFYILTNPTNGSTANLNNLYNLIPGTAPFQPSLSSAPTDWTVAINYSSTGTCGTSNGNFISRPQELALDVYGNVWFANGQAGTGNLSGISPGGTAISCTFQGGGDAHGLALDTAGNIWYASHAGNTLYRYNPISNVTTPFATTSAPLAVFADGGNGSGDTVSNIYFTTDADTSVYMIAHGATAAGTTAPVQISSVVGANPNHLMVDDSHAIWVSSGTTFVSRIAPGTAGDPNFLNGYTTAQFPVPANSSAVTVAPGAGAVYVSSDAASTVTSLSGSGNNYSTTSGWPNLSGAGGINNPKAVAVDGRLNIWTVNGTANSGSGLYSLGEVSANGVALMPSGTTAGGRQVDSSFLADPRAIVIDMSGNVWVAGNGPVGTPSNSITEIVGAAVPVYQPFSVGLSNGRFQRLP